MHVFYKAVTYKLHLYKVITILYKKYLTVAKIPSTLFKQIERYMPFSSVDVAILKDEKIILTKRNIAPYRGYWHLPGSIILKNEKMIDTVKSCTTGELGIEVLNPTFVGNYETFTRYRHYITHLFVAKYKSGKITLDFQSIRETLVDSHTIPNHTVPIQKLMIYDVLTNNIK